MVRFLSTILLGFVLFSSLPVEALAPGSLTEVLSHTPTPSALPQEMFLEDFDEEAPFVPPPPENPYFSSLFSKFKPSAPRPY